MLKVRKRITSARDGFVIQREQVGKLFFYEPLDKLWQGKPRAMLSALTHLKIKAPAGAKALVQENIVYFQNQQPRMHYDQYRAAGLPIGSGTVESAAPPHWCICA